MSQSIGKILDELMRGEIDKQRAVTKLQWNRNQHTKKAIIAAHNRGNKSNGGKK